MDLFDASNDNLITICDKFSRFEPAHIRLKKLSDYVLSRYYHQKNIREIDDYDRINIAADVINTAFKPLKSDEKLNKILFKLEDKYFYNNELSYQYLSPRMNISSLISNIEVNNKTPKNVIWLKNILNSDYELEEIRYKNSLLYPLEGIILCEGQTEYTLLCPIFNLFNVNFDKLGFIIIPAGGKNQVARKYYEMVEYTRLPIFVLLDSDAKLVEDLIQTKLRPADTLYLIKSGEFEDLIPKKILLETINNVHKNDFNCSMNDFIESELMTSNLDKIYKKYGFGEFKKAQFAKELNEFIISNCSREDFASSEIVKIVNLFVNKNLMKI